MDGAAMMTGHMDTFVGMYSETSTLGPLAVGLWQKLREFSDPAPLLPKKGRAGHPARPARQTMLTSACA